MQSMHFFIQGDDFMIYNNIKAIRLEQNLSLSQLAHLSGLSIGYICHLENGTRTNPSMKVMSKICHALNRNLTDVFNI